MANGSGERGGIQIEMHLTPALQAAVKSIPDKLEVIAGFLGRIAVQLEGGDTEAIQALIDQMEGSRRPLEAAEAAQPPFPTNPQ